jgi:hypothetical protein
MFGFARTDSLKVQEININNIVEQTLFIVEKDFFKSNINCQRSYGSICFCISKSYANPAGDFRYYVKCLRCNA